MKSNCTVNEELPARQRPRLLLRVAAVIMLPTFALLTACDSDDGTASPASPESSDASSGAVPPVTFLADDAHAELPLTEGCDQLNFHAAMSMWNPALADELLEYGCPFPYEPELISMDGGAEDTDLDAPFEPRRYQEIYDILADEVIGICSVTRLAEPSVGGFVYGFGNTLKADTCANNDPNIELAAREYASRAHRDEAAHAFAPSVDRAMVLGRWVISVDGDDAEAIDRLATRLEAIGAAAVAP